MNSDKLNIVNKIIADQSKLIELFDKWVQEIKANKLKEASEIVKEVSKLRIVIDTSKKQLDKLNSKKQ